MPADRVIAATFSDVQPVKTRSVYKLIFEIPIEDADKAIELLGGHPQPGKEKWVALALLVEKPAQKAPEKAERPKREFSKLSLPEQAGIRCQDQAFQMFLRASGYAKPDDYDAAIVVRRLCNIESRASLATDNVAAGRWLALNTGFEHWQTDQRYADMKR